MLIVKNYTNDYISSPLPYIHSVVLLRMYSNFDFGVKSNDATHTYISRGSEKMYHLDNEIFRGEQIISPMLIQTWLEKAGKGSSLGFYDGQEGLLG